MNEIPKPSGGKDAVAAALSKEPLDVEPPPELEERTVAGLRTGGLVGPKEAPAWRSAAMILAAVVFAGVIFFGGLLSGRQMSGASGGASRFVLLLYGASTGDDVNARAARAMEYSAWADESHDAGRVLTGETLSADGALLRLAVTEAQQEGDSAAVAGPEAEELGGYFVVSAANMNDAVRLAREHSHLKHGGTIIVRPLFIIPE